MVFNVSTFCLSISLWHSHLSNLIGNTSIAKFCVAHALLLEMKELRLMEIGLLGQGHGKTSRRSQSCYGPSRALVPP